MPPMMHTHVSKEKISFAFFLSPMPRVMEISAVPPVPTIKPSTLVSIR